jgi:hypothetical protein
MAVRPGFLVPNAVDVGGDLDISEPDALDFNLLGSHRYGVLRGCDISVTGSSWVVNVANGIWVVNGQLATGGGQVTLPHAASNPRFDLIVGDAAGHVSGLLGVPDLNPVFPEYDSTMCVFASVLVKPGATAPQTVDVTDKRIILAQNFVTAMNDGDGPLVLCVNPADMSRNFQIDPDGRLSFGTDNSFIEHDDANGNGVYVSLNLRVEGTATTGGDLDVGGALNTTGPLVGSNFRQGLGNPSGTGANGDIYKDTSNGNVWAYQAGTWQQLSFTNIPPGMTMTTFLPTPPAGWLLVNGQTISKLASGGLWNAFPAWRTSDGMNMVLPDARNCFFMYGTPGTTGGSSNGMLALQTTNLPPHKHLVSPTTGAGGSHTHSASSDIQGNHSHTTGNIQGAHLHGVSDPGHVHPAAPGGGGPPAILTRVFAAPAGYAQGDQPIVLTPNTGSATTGFNSGGTGGPGVNTAGSNHVHTTDVLGNHQHTITIGPGGGTHSHPITENMIGSGTPIDIRPPFIGMYLLIKT